MFEKDEKARVQKKVSQFFQGSGKRTEEVRRRCRTVLEERMDQILAIIDVGIPCAGHVDPALVLV
jgi:hypothetical protein